MKTVRIIVIAFTFLGFAQRLADAYAYVKYGVMQPANAGTIKIGS